MKVTSISINTFSEEIRERLFELQDKIYGDFQSKLTPTLDRETFIGVRVPLLRKLAKEIAGEARVEGFLDGLPHKYFEENMLHGILVSEINEYDTCIQALDTFLPYVDNWAVCDTISPKIFKKSREKLLGKILDWSNSEDTYTCRFGIGMLMKHFLDKDFKVEYLEIPSRIESEEYYVNMMIAWFYATALAKQWEATIKYIEENKLGTWVHNKTIQKAVESYRINDEQKVFLKKLKI